jgi:hypothetical protein
MLCGIDAPQERPDSAHREPQRGPFANGSLLPLSPVLGARFSGAAVGWSRRRLGPRAGPDPKPPANSAPHPISFADLAHTWQSRSSSPQANPQANPQASRQAGAQPLTHRGDQPPHSTGPQCRILRKIITNQTLNQIRENKPLWHCGHMSTTRLVATRRVR